MSDLSGASATTTNGDYSLALEDDGTIRAWGRNENGRLGDGTNGTDRHTPVQVQSVSEVKAIAAVPATTWR